MKKQILGKNLKVSAVSLGCMGMTHAYGAPSDINEMAKLIAQAVDIGYTMFDTAESYTGINPNGSIAYNEELVGKSLKPYRDKVIIASKFGVEITASGLQTDSRPSTIRKSIEGSLERLGTDYIDLYYQYRVDPNIPVEEVAGVIYYYRIPKLHECDFFESPMNRLFT
jgi:aryl-alcohol dehydrogenase-like predicted oxidoreductase